LGFIIDISRIINAYRINFQSLLGFIELVNAVRICCRALTFQSLLGFINIGDGDELLTKVSTFNPFWDLSIF